MPEQATGEPSTRGQRIGGRSSRRRLRLLMFAVTGSVLTAIVLGAYAADVFRDSELDTVDARFSIRGDQDPPEDIVVVAIDDVTFNELQRALAVPAQPPRARDRPPQRRRREGHRLRRPVHRAQRGPGARTTR